MVPMEQHHRRLVHRDGANRAILRFPRKRMKRKDLFERIGRQVTDTPA